MNSTGCDEKARRAPRHSAEAGFTIIELLISSFIALIVVYGASFLYLHYFRAMERGKDKLRLQGDATYASEYLVRLIRPADSVYTDNNLTVTRLQTFRQNTPTGEVRVVSSTLNGKTYQFLVGQVGPNVYDKVVPSPFKSLQFTQAGGLGNGAVVDFSLALTDTSGNTVVTTASAGLRNHK